jgi:hypothetical protein
VVKKCHTKIVLCASDRAGRAIYVGKLKAGHKVDFKLFDDRDAARKKKMFLIVIITFLSCLIYKMQLFYYLAHHFPQELNNS